MSHTLYTLFVEPWVSGAWMWRGTLAALLAALPCAALGVFLYLRRMSLIADALAHTALLGVVCAFLLTGSMSPQVMLLGALISGVITTVSIQGLERLGSVRPDAAVGIVFSTLFALGVVLLTMFARGAHIDTQCVLFGDVLGVSDDALWLLAMVAPVVLLAIVAGLRWLELISFDESFARHLGVPVLAVHYSLMGLTALTTVAAFEAIGAILVIAMIIVPAATAHILASRLRGMVAWALLHATLSAVLGMYVAVWLDLSASGAIVVTGGALHLLARLFAPGYGSLSLAWRARMRRRRGKSYKNQAPASRRDSARPALPASLKVDQR